MKRASLLRFLLSLALSVVPKAQAQFIGYVSPQTVQQSLATNLACSGAAQTFAINNLGQTQHWISVTTAGVQQFQAEIDGIDTQGNVYRISDQMEAATTGILRTGSLSGSGYFAKIQALVTCTAGTFTLSYSGGWGTFQTSAGSYQTAQIDKITFNGLASNAAAIDAVQTPFGSSAGTFYFQSVAGIAGATLTIQCSSNSILTGTAAINLVGQLNLQSTGNVQSFQVPDLPCSSVIVKYGAGSAGTTFSGEYIFSLPGVANRAAVDPCSFTTVGTQQNRTSSAVSVAAATTTQVLAASAFSYSYYICGYQLSQAATAGTVQWVYGTGANCGTGTTNLTGAMPTTAGQPFSYGNGTSFVMKVPASNELCITATGAGGTVSGIVTFTAAP